MVHWQTARRADRSKKDLITDEYTRINDVHFKGSITYKEATTRIFTEALGLPRTLLHSIKMSYDKVRMVMFKLNNQIDLEELSDKRDFKFERIFMTGETEVTESDAKSTPFYSLGL